MAEPMDVDASATSPPATGPSSAPKEADIKAAVATPINANSASSQAGQASAAEKEPQAKRASTASDDELVLAPSESVDGETDKKTDDEATPEAKSCNSKTLKRLNSDVSVGSTATEKTASTAPKKKKAKKGGKSGRKSPATTSARAGKTGYHGGFRSAAAAHRNRQIHVPPLGSPGLLMPPTPAAMAVFPSIENEDGDLKKDVENYLVTGEDGGDYLLPATVFKQSMIAGGYTYDKRKARPHRGSSTERHVGDMFDSDAGGLCLHFPELIPTSIWDHRLGDGRVVVEDVRPPSPKKEGGGLTSSDFKEAKKSGAARPGPKGARSSYIFFTNEQRPKMVLEFPGVRFAEQGVIMGERWRALTPEERKPYEDKAIKDKERYAREMREYVGLVKRDMEEEKGSKEGTATDHSSKGPSSEVKEESKEGDDESKEGDDDKEDEPSKVEVSKGPRLVDSVILSLSKMLGEKVNRKEVPETSPLVPDPVSSAQKPDAVSSAGAETEEEGVKAENEALEKDASDPPPPRRVTPDLTVDELPKFTPSSPGTLPHSEPHKPMSFLSMLPITLTATYPPAHVAAKKAYARDVRKREEAIVEAQEAKDDADDAKEKYAAHTEAWERMLDYQKSQVAKREAERKKKREVERQLAEESGTEKQEVADKTKNESNGTKAAEGTGDNDSGSGGADKKEATTAEGKTPADGGESNSSTVPEEEKEAAPADKKTPVDGSPNSDAVAEEKKTPPRAPTPPPEDPMDYMPPRPQKPEPARVVTIPEIPIPPSPPRVVTRETTSNDVQKSEGGDQQGGVKAEDIPMEVPKLDRSLLHHLDPTFFQPTISGRYFGLLSNHIADPQFHGILAPGIAGTTYGGGSGLATSYVGGKGTQGLVSGPVRGGLWDRSTSVGSKSGGGSEKKKSRDEKKSKSSKAASDALKSLKDASTAKGDGSTSSAAPSSSKKKRRASDGDGSAEKKKKPKRTLGLLGLATGDRKTTATEVGSGPAGADFPDGWIVKTYRRSGGETVGKTDRFWFSPGRNIRFRARKHAVAFQEILSEPDVDGDEDRAAEIYRARGLHF